MGLEARWAGCGEDGPVGGEDGPPFLKTQLIVQFSSFFHLLVQLLELFDINVIFNMKPYIFRLERATLLSERTAWGRWATFFQNSTECPIFIIFSPTCSVPFELFDINSISI